MATSELKVYYADGGWAYEYSVNGNLTKSGACEDSESLDDAVVDAASILGVVTRVEEFEVCPGYAVCVFDDEEGPCQD